MPRIFLFNELLLLLCALFVCLLSLSTVLLLHYTQTQRKMCPLAQRESQPCKSSANSRFQKLRGLFFIAQMNFKKGNNMNRPSSACRFSTIHALPRAYACKMSSVDLHDGICLSSLSMPQHCGIVIWCLKCPLID